MNIKDKIIEKIKINKISSTEIADCLEKKGALNNVYALNSGHHKVGEVFWTYAYNNSNWELHKQLEKVPKDCIVLTDVFLSDDNAVYGELVSKYLILYKQVEGIVVNAKLRDVNNLIKENWPIWFTGPSPIGFNNTKNINQFDLSILNKYQKKYKGAIAVCDDTGVVVITIDHINNDFLEKLNWIENQEDIWFDCLDRKKMSTFEIVCEKKYLNDKT